ncbi:MAG: ABC transporter permease [Chloroflexi bacterium]|nr:ABC transporter permease [Chloroflexota bacterium]
MNLLRTYILPRILQWALVIFVGISATFLIPRLSPRNPVDEMIGRMTAFASIDPHAVVSMRESATALFGLDGTLLEQYVRFWGRLLEGDLGVSFGNFPRKVSDIIAAGLPWSVGLLTTTIIISWTIGVFLGALAGYFHNRRWSQFLERFVVVVYPVPYLITALVLFIIFGAWLQIFPIMGGSRGEPALTWKYISTVLYFGFLPALSIVIGAIAFRFIMAKALTTTEIANDYVQYAELAAVPKRKIILFYVARNTMLPQVTDLALAFGAIFEGALITEILFAYPGLGFVLYNAIYNADYNIIMGIALLSIVGVATAMLIIDLLYPVLDPRVRLR